MRYNSLFAAVILMSCSILMADTPGGENIETDDGEPTSEVWSASRPVSAVGAIRAESDEIVVTAPLPRIDGGYFPGNYFVSHTNAAYLKLHPSTRSEISNLRSSMDGHLLQLAGLIETFRAQDKTTVQSEISSIMKIFEYDKNHREQFNNYLNSATTAPSRRDILIDFFIGLYLPSGESPGTATDRQKWARVRQIAEDKADVLEEHINEISQIILRNQKGCPRLNNEDVCSLRQILLMYVKYAGTVFECTDCNNN